MGTCDSSHRDGHTVLRGTGLHIECKRVVCTCSNRERTPASHNKLGSEEDVFMQPTSVVDPVPGPTADDEEVVRIA